MHWITLTVFCWAGISAKPGQNLTGRGELVWSDEFDTLDETKWKHFVSAWRGGNHEFQYYRNDRKNSFVDEGVLTLKPSYTADEFGEDFLYSGELNLWDQGCEDSMNIDGGCVAKGGGDYIVNPIQSAKLVSEGKFSFTYGAFEVSAKLPKGDWLWPAIWLLPQDWEYGSWPLSGEIDLCESRGNTDLKCDGNWLGHQAMGSTMHWGPDPGNNHWWQTHFEKVNEDDTFSDSFHTYRFEWNTDGITYYVDGENIGGIYPPAGGFWELGGFDGQNIWGEGSKMAPFDKDFYIILNLAVGGNFFPDGCVNGNGDKPWEGESVPGAMKGFWEAKDQWQKTWNMDTKDPTLQIDYIRVYKL